MARRIVIEDECPIHGGYGPHWSSGQQNSNGPYRTCQISQRRVLDPGSYVLIEKVDGEWPLERTQAAIRTLPFEERYDHERYAQAILDALAGGEQP